MTRTILFAAGVLFTAGVMGAAGATGCSSSPTASTDGGTDSASASDTSSPTVDGSTPTTDSSTGTDSAAPNPVFGGWINGPVVSTSDAKQSTLRAYAFAADGTYAYNRVVDYPDGTGVLLEGCQSTTIVNGKYAVSGSSVSMTPTSGTIAIQRCSDDTLDKPMAPLAAGDSDLAAQTGQVTGASLKVGDLEYKRP